MKSKEIFDLFIHDIKSNYESVKLIADKKETTKENLDLAIQRAKKNDMDIVKNILNIFIADLKEISEKRYPKGKCSSGFKSVFIELNNKWNSLCVKFEKELGYQYLGTDGFLRYVSKLPMVKDILNKI